MTEHLAGNPQWHRDKVCIVCGRKGGLNFLARNIKPLAEVNFTKAYKRNERKWFELYVLYVIYLSSASNRIYMKREMHTYIIYEKSWIWIWLIDFLFLIKSMHKKVSFLIYCYLKRHYLYFRLFSPFQNLHTRKINTINVFQESFTSGTQKLMFKYWIFTHSLMNRLYACKQIHIDTWFKMHSNGNIIKISLRGVYFKFIYLMTNPRLPSTFKRNIFLTKNLS